MGIETGCPVFFVGERFKEFCIETAVADGKIREDFFFEVYYITP